MTTRQACCAVLFGLLCTPVWSQPAPGTIPEVPAAPAKGEGALKQQQALKKHSNQTARDKGVHHAPSGGKASPKKGAPGSPAPAAPAPGQGNVPAPNGAAK